MIFINEKLYKGLNIETFALAHEARAKFQKMKRAQSENYICKYIPTFRV